MANKEELLIRSPSGRWRVSVFTCNCISEDVPTEYEKVFAACQLGCKNYDRKYSCPPRSPKFSEITKNKPFGLILSLRLELEQFKQKKHFAIKMGNSMLKSRLDYILEELRLQNRKLIFLSSGSCRLCRPCKAVDSKPCKHPAKRKFSLEATGVNCCELVQEMFNFELEWYKQDECQYTAVVGGIFGDKKSIAELQSSFKSTVCNLLKQYEKRK